jgi:hypothetical protein
MVIRAGVAGQKFLVRRIEVKQTAPAPGGLAVWLKTTVYMAVPDGSRQSMETVSEVTEPLEVTLPDKLF